MKRWGMNAAQQKIVTMPVSIVTIAGSSAVPATPYVYFRVPVPDSRLRVKISILFIPAAGALAEFDATGFASLWLYEVEEDISGVSGRWIQCNNIEGTEAAPTAVPDASPLLGYSREFVSAADAIEGKFTMVANITLGTWVLQTRYQPESVSFTPSEWDAIASQCEPTLKTSPFTIT